MCTKYRWIVNKYRYRLVRRVQVFYGRADGGNVQCSSAAPKHMTLMSINSSNRRVTVRNGYDSIDSRGAGRSFSLPDAYANQELSVKPAASRIFRSFVRCACARSLYSYCNDDDDDGSARNRRCDTTLHRVRSLPCRRLAPRRRRTTCHRRTTSACTRNSNSVQNVPS